MKLMLAFVLLSGLLLATESVSEQQFETQTGGSPLEIVKYWQALAVMSLMLSVILVGIGYAVGIGLEMPEVKAWASNELVQIVANALIIVVLIATISFIDAIVMGMAIGSGLDPTLVPACYTVGQSCLQNVTMAYLNDYVDTAEVGARDILRANMYAGSAAGKRLGFYCTTAFLPLFCLQAGIGTTVAGHYVLDQDMYAILFEYYTNLLSTLEAQRFFVNEISFKMGPVILAIGIVARSFFFTRKIGGLLIAVAAGIMFFFPGMYIFDWVTLDMAVNGDKLMNDDVPLCPNECSIAAPTAYYDGGNLVSPFDVYGAFTDADSGTVQQLLAGTLDRATGSNPGSPAYNKDVVSCYYGSMADCPVPCRELPYPPSAGNCSVLEVQQACAQVPAECKVARLVNTTAPSFDQAEYNRCPASCKVVPPLNPDCTEDTDGSTGQCLESRFDCRIAKRSDLNWRPSTVDIEGSNYADCVKASNCQASLTASENCVWVIPDTGNCQELCTDACPAECRIADADPADLPAQCKDGAALKGACIACITNYDSCTVRLSDITSLNPPAGQCDSCPVEKRLVSSSLPNDYITGGCSVDACSKDYRVAVPRNTCESCLFTEESYVYSPPINSQCAELCGPTNNAPVKSSGEYTKIGGEGLVGKVEIQNVAKLMIPAYLLPLFNIVATLVFIKGLSGLLGGDIEIPGLAKVF